MPVTGADLALPRLRCRRIRSGCGLGERYVTKGPNPWRGPFMMGLGALLVTVATVMLVSHGADYEVGNRGPTGLWAPIVIAIGLLNLTIGVVYTIRDRRS